MPEEIEEEEKEISGEKETFGEEIKERLRKNIEDFDDTVLEFTIEELEGKDLSKAARTFHQAAKEELEKREQEGM